MLWSGMVKFQIIGVGVACECLQGEGDALACGTYRGMQLVEHAMKVLDERH